MEISAENSGRSNTTGQPDKAGESMKDSMSESPENNDNTLLPSAEELTDEKGELDPEAFKEAYRQPGQTGPANNINITYKKHDDEN